MTSVTASDGKPSLWHRLRGALTRREWCAVAGMASVVIGLHAVGFFILLTVVAPHHYHLGPPGRSRSGSA